jgi:hypothetical protein
MRKREAIEPRNKLERKPMYCCLQQAAMRTRKRESAQVPSGSESSETRKAQRGQLPRNESERRVRRKSEKTEAEC